MKIKQGYIVKQVAGTNVVVPVSNSHFSAIISVNDTGAFLFEKLKNDVDKEFLVNLLLSEYDVFQDVAKKDVDLFLNQLSKAGLLDE